MPKYLLLAISLWASPCLAASSGTYIYDSDSLIKNTYSLVTGLLSGNPTIAGSPTYLNPVVFQSSVTGNAFFGDGSHLTFSGTTPITGSVRISTGNYLEMTDPGPSGVINHSGQVVWAKSMDGAASISSGCIVALYMSDASPGAEAVFTSTNVGIDQYTQDVTAGVLLESCSPGSRCRIGISGIYRVQMVTGGQSQTDRGPVFSTTYCKVDQSASYNPTVIGLFMNATSDSSGFVWIRLVGAK